MCWNLFDLIVKVSRLVAKLHEDDEAALIDWVLQESFPFQMAKPTKLVANLFKEN